MRIVPSRQANRPSTSSVASTASVRATSPSQRGASTMSAQACTYGGWAPWGTTSTVTTGPPMTIWPRQAWPAGSMPVNERASDRRTSSASTSMWRSCIAPER